MREQRDGAVRWMLSYRRSFVNSKLRATRRFCCWRNIAISLTTPPDSAACSVDFHARSLEHLPKVGEALVAFDYSGYVTVLFNHDVRWEDADLKRTWHFIL
jgi:hypothetical protein